MRLILLFLAILMASVVYRASLESVFVTEPVVMEGMTIVGSVPIEPTHNITEVATKVIWYESKAELNRIYTRNCSTQIQTCHKSVLAFTNVWPDSGYCEIHALKPVNIDAGRMDTLGHEFAHCLFGSFHK